MKKRIIMVLSALALAAFVAVPVGCGPGASEQIEVSDEAKAKQVHSEASEEMEASDNAPKS